MARINQLITITAGTPIQLSKIPLIASRIFIQMAVGGAGNGQVITVPVGVTPAAHGGTAGQLTAQLAAASATAPGGGYSDAAYPHDGGGINLQQMWLDGDTNGDTVIVSYDQRV